MVLVSHSSSVPSQTTLQFGLHRILESHSSYLFIPRAMTLPLQSVSALLHIHMQPSLLGTNPLVFEGGYCS